MTAIVFESAVSEAIDDNSNTGQVGSNDPKTGPLKLSQVIAKFPGSEAYKKLAKKELRLVKHTYDYDDEHYSSTSKRFGNLEPFSSPMIISTVFDHFFRNIFRDIRADVNPG